MTNRALIGLKTFMMLFIFVQFSWGQGYQRIYDSQTKPLIINSANASASGGGYFLADMFLDANNIGILVTRHEPKGDIMWGADILIENGSYNIGAKSIDCFSLSGDTLLVTGYYNDLSDGSDQNFMLMLEPSQGNVIWSNVMNNVDSQTSGFSSFSRMLSSNDNTNNYIGTANSVDTVGLHFEKLNGNATVTSKSYYGTIFDTLQLGLQLTDASVVDDSTYFVSTGSNFIDISTLIHFNQEGTPEMSRFYLLPGFATAIRAVSPTPDTGFVASALLTDLMSGLSLNIVFKTDDAGLLEWSKIITLFDSNKINIPTDMNVTQSGEVLVMSRSIDPATAEVQDHGFFLDQNGDLLRQFNYGGPFPYWALQFQNGFVLQSLHGDISNLTDGTILYSGTGFDAGTGLLSPLVYKMDQTGMAMCHELLMQDSTVLDFPMASDTLLLTETNLTMRDTLEVTKTSFDDWNIPIINLLDTFYCPQDPIFSTLDATTNGATLYAWSTGADTPTITVTEEGEYSVTVTVMDKLCFTLCDTSMISQGEFPEASIAIDFDRYCEFGEYGLIANSTTDVSGGVMWSNDETTQTITVPADAGTLYSVTITDNCENTAEATITLPADPSDEGQIVTDLSPICEFGFADLTASSPSPFGPKEYMWDNGETSPSIQVTAPGGTFNVTITDSCGNEAYASASVSPDAFNVMDPTISIEVGSITDCVLPLTAIGETFSPQMVENYLWNTGSTDQILIVDAPGTYTVAINDECSITGEATASVTITEEDLATPAPEPVITQGDLSNICAIPLTVEPNSDTEEYTVLWSTNSAQESIVTSQPGTYTVTVIDACGNEGTAEITLTSDDFDLGELFVDIVIGDQDEECMGQVSAVLDSLDNRAVSYSWSNGSTERIQTIDLMEEISVTVTDACGNTATATKLPGGEDPLWPDIFFVSRPFHEENATFGPYVPCPQLFSEYSLEIFNRWGKKVFEADNIQERWSGSLNNAGQRLEEDVYMYQANWINADGSEGKQKGSVTMIR